MLGGGAAFRGINPECTVSVLELDHGTRVFYDVRHATIAGTDKDHRFVVLDQELMRIRLRHFLDNLGRQWLQFDVQRHSVADSVARRPLPKPYTIRKGARTKG